MSSIWAVARQTLSQCLRMKIGVMFIIILALTLALLPSVCAREGATLANQLRTFISYSTTFTRIGLAVVTVLLSASVIAGDIRTKQIFLLASKPLARWQYIMGRFVGIMLLDAILLAIAGTLIFTLAQHMREGQALNNADRRTVESEVFTARELVIPDPGPINAAIEQETNATISRLRDNGQWDAAIEAFMERADGDRALAGTLAAKEIKDRTRDKLQTIAPDASQTWIFRNVWPQGKMIERPARVMAINRSERQIVIEAPTEVVSRLLWGGPVNINRVLGDVVEMGGNYVAVLFSSENMADGQLAKVAQDSIVSVGAEPMIQISYRGEPASTPIKGFVDSRWVVDSGAGWVRETVRRDKPDATTTITLPARAVGPDGTVRITYTNVHSEAFYGSLTIRPNDINVLYRVDSFTMNYARAMIQILLSLAVLAAAGLLAGSFLSFPVASLLCFAFMTLTIMCGFLAEAAAIGSKTEFFLRDVGAMFSNLSPSTKLVDGANIAWSDLGLGVLAATAMAGAALALGCYIFQKREVARVQV